MTTGQPLILAIDLGTSGVKCAVVAADGSIFSTGRAPIETIVRSDGSAEQDPRAAWDAVVTAGREATSAMEAPGEIMGVACTSQFSSIVPVDETGEPTMNMVTWMDKRGTFEALREYPGGRKLVPGPLDLVRWLRIHGIPPLSSGADSLSHMRWIKLARPEVYARTATFLEPMDFVTMRLSGQARTNPCSAFLMLLVDNRRLREPRYHPGLVRRSGIDPSKLPALCPIDEDVGTLQPEAARLLGVPAGARVFASSNDTQAGSVATFSLSGRHAGINVGTSSGMVTHVGFKRSDVRSSLVSMPSPVPGAYLVMGENGIGGRAIEHFLDRIVFATDGFGDHRLEEKFAALGRAVGGIEPGSGGVIFLPWLAGSMSPAEDCRVRGGFLNMSLETTREHLGRAVLEGVALNFRWLLGAVERFTKRRLTHLVFYGGGAVSDLWSQIIADVVRVPVHQIADPRYAICRGTALLGFSRAGLFDLNDLSSRVPIRRVYEPAKDLGPSFERIFAQFLRAFASNRRIFRALNP